MINTVNDISLFIITVFTLELSSSGCAYVYVVKLYVHVHKCMYILCALYNSELGHYNYYIAIL